MEYISIVEYQEYTKLNLNIKNSLQEYLEKQKDNDLLQNVFTFTSKGIKANHYVGVLKYKNCQFEILPKLLNKDNPTKEEKQNILHNLLYMLSLTKELDIKESEISKLCKCKNPFLEILIKIYANSLFDSLKRFVPKNYIVEEDNLNFLKGKLLFSKHIVKNSVNQAKFYCQYDEFSENNLLNQLFYYVSHLLYLISNDNENKRILKFITDFFCDIDFKKININKIKNLKLNKNQVTFTKPFNLAKMFLENSSIDMNQQKINSISLLWDMNKLFEEFIYEFIKKYKQEINKQITDIKYQKGKKILKYLGNDSDYRLIRNTYVDILLELDKEKIIIDTKYKVNEGKKGEFANADIFQMLAYETIHTTKEKPTNNAILLYPTTDENINKEEKKGINKYQFVNGDLGIEKYLTTATIYLGEPKDKLIKTLKTRLSKIILESLINN